MAKTRNSVTRWEGLVLAFGMLCSLALPAAAQNKSSGEKTTPELSLDSARKSSDLPVWAASNDSLKPESWGPFEVKQIAEFGGRITDFTGNAGTWDSYVNMGTGPRLLEYTIDLNSPTHAGYLFDKFNFSNFGYGGDPNNLSRLTLSKGKIYNFGASFRRDQNIFDYNLFANPLNPATSNPSVPIINSPHEFLLTRRMYDANLGLFPVGSIRFKAGWSRVVNEGTSYSSVHEGTEGLLFQPTLNTTDNFNGEVSFRFIPRTSINYNQFYTYYKGDTSADLATPQQAGVFGIPGFNLATGVPVQLGLPFNTPAGQPCATPVLATGFANPACNAFIGYGRTGNLRTSYPTEQLSFQSNYWKKLDLAGRFGYSSAEAGNPAFDETFNGLITRSRVRQFAQVGSSLARRISANADFAATYDVTNKLSIVEQFRWDNFRIPTSWSYVTGNLFAATLTANPNVFSPATCPPPFTAATCPQHINASPADLILDQLGQFLRQETFLNTLEAEYAFTPKVSAYLGYRYSHRDITLHDSDTQVQTFFPGPTAALANRGACVGVPLNADGTCTAVVTDVGDDEPTIINYQSALFGVSGRPNNRIRFSFDTELAYADNAFTRISPRHLQIYKGRLSAKPKDWWNAGIAINIRENRNTAADINNKQHNRSYVFTSTLSPAGAIWGVDLSYSYNDIYSQSNICFVSTPVVAPNGGPLTCGTPFLSGLSIYNEQSNYGSGSIYLKPVSRLTTSFGYTITSSNGDTLILNPIAPTGPLAFNYHLPSASLAFDITKNLTYKTGWNYYDYNEKSLPGPTLPRDFRGNTFTLALRYTM
ncbi:MAG TPA: hypothetical protein VE783_02385 [Candidatus Limnocylindrales bacterium]|nr:hypothetical protein [Candidatus Limnocylindrales bacterium]